MTKEELEKKSEGYANEYGQDAFTQFNMPQMIEPVRIERKLGFQKGAEFGYNKANEWHYPSKGEYPKKHQLVLGIFQPNEYYTPTKLVYYEKELNCWSNQLGESEYHNIYAWKEIVLPKESK